MASRLIEIVVPTEAADRVRAILDGTPGTLLFDDHCAGARTMMRVLAAGEGTEAVTDRLEPAIAALPDARIVLLPVEAVIPRPTDPAPAGRLLGARVGREELYADLRDATRSSSLLVVLSVLSAVVAAMGLLNDNIAVIIGAMVIAPLLGPNMSLALATTLGDVALARRAAFSNFLGASGVLVVSTALGLFLDVDPAGVEIARRTVVGHGDVALALAAGVAGVLAFTTGAPAALIGVMVAVALVPPLVALGLLLGAGHATPARGAAMLLLVNVIGVNLAAVATFLAQGVRPLSWWQAERARRAAALAVAAWVTLLALLVIAIVLGAAAPP